MFSSDKNIDTIVDLINALKHQGTLRLEMIKLETTDKAVRILTTLLTLAFIIAFIWGIIFFLSVAMALFIGDVSNSMIIGFSSIAVIYVFLFLLIFLKRKAWIERPLVRLFASILLEDPQQSPEQL